MKTIAAPTVEPITLDELRLHLRLDPVAGPHPDDTLIASQLSAAREWAEQYIGCAIAPRTVEFALDDFPPGPIEMQGGAVQSIESLVYLDEDGIEQTLPSNLYALDDYSTPNWLLPAYGSAWPATYDAANAVRVRYVLAGAFNAAIRAALLLMVGTLYETREGESEKRSTPIALGVQALLQPYRANLGV